MGNFFTNFTNTPSILGNLSICFCKTMPIFTSFSFAHIKVMPSFRIIRFSRQIRVSLPSQSRSYSFTFGTYPSAIIINISMYFKFVTSNAMRLSLVNSSGTNTSKYIFFLSNWFEMIRVHARAVATNMIQGQPFRYFSFKQFISESMSQNPFGRFDNKLAITAAGNRTLPKPATFSFINFFPKSFHSRPSYLLCLNRSRRFLHG